ncbi:MAG TPA: AAA family ATPase [Devosia sp.]|nr:AAA family ATPase [Devosia sp.]
MKLTALRLHNVKRFAGRGIAIEGIGDGVNVLSAANEYGKSTCFEALHALFFQPHTGTPKSVQLLRPYSGGNPLVEADIAIAGGRFRLTKQYYGGKRASVTDLATGRLVAQADEAERFLADLIRGGSAGPAGLLWIRQGVTGIERRSNSEEESDKRVRESLLSSVQGEVEALTGGRRMAEIAAACDNELLTLVTATLRPKAGGRYAAALDERDRLLQDEQRLAAEVAVLRDALDTRRSAIARLAELENTDEAAERHAAVTAAEAALDAAKSHSEALKTAEAETALAQNHLLAAGQAQAAFQAALKRVSDLRQRALEMQGQRDAAAERRTTVLADSDRALAEVQTAEEEEREARSLLARLDAALQARDAAERLTELRQRLAQAEAARQQVEDGEAALAMLALPQQTVDQLQALEIDIVGLRVAQAATLPTFRIDYLAGAEGSVTVEAKAVPQGEEQSFVETAHLEIAGIGTLALRSNRPQQADQALDKAEAAHHRLLMSLGVDNLAAARQRLQAARDQGAALDLARQRLADLAPKGIAQLQAEVARLAALSATDLEIKADPTEVRLRLAVAEQQLTASRNAAHEIQPFRIQADAALVAAEKTCAGIEAELGGLQASLGPEVEWPERERALADTYAARKEQHEAAEAQAAPLRSAAHDLASAEAAVSRTRSAQNAAEKEIGQLRETLANLNGNINVRSDDAVEEAWRETADALTAAQERVQRFETEIAVLDRLRKALAAARSAASELYLKPVISELRPLLGLLFDDISIIFDETTLLPQTVRRNGLDEEVERLSGGMREQLSILTRLAFARLLARDGRPTPVILDDALVYSDDDRIERMFDALHRQARDQQILVFSCRQRAFAKLGGTVLQMREWSPHPV